MAFGAAIVGAFAGGIASAMATNYMNNQLASAYKDAAKKVKAAAEKYSGQNAYNSMQNAGSEEANIMNRQALGAEIQNTPKNTSALMSNVSDVNGNYVNGYNTGVNNEKTNLNAKYNAETAEAQQMMKQAGIEYQVNNQALQTGLNSAAGVAGLYSDYKKGSDENMKEGINNKSGLPESDIEDSLRQLETVSYKYKDPNIPGCDGEVHESGFTAQSLEKTPLGKDAVETGPDGYKRIDQWKLREALMAGMAQLQREIDELEGKNGKE